MASGSFATVAQLLDLRTLQKSATALVPFGISPGLDSTLSSGHRGRGSGGTRVDPFAFQEEGQKHET